MQSALIDAIERKRTLTENGMPTESTSGKELLNLFFTIGAARQLPDNVLVGMFSKAYHEDPLNTLKTFAYNRDIRSGQGERKTFRLALSWLTSSFPDVAKQLMPFIPEYGRWDDLLAFCGTRLQNEALEFWATAIRNKDGLACKWAPRENKKYGFVAKLLAKILDMSPKEYRRHVAANSSTVEDKMCAKEWSEINYSHVPSKAANIYKSAFSRNDAERYVNYLKELAKPESERDPNVKVNASAIFPHDVIKDVYSLYAPTQSDLDLIAAQWEALPTFLPEGNSVLPVVDVSGSMNTYDQKPTPLLVALSLGLYLSERLKGPFEDCFITFSTIPKLQKLKGNILERLRQLNRAQWDMSTNFEGVFNLILSQAVKHNVPQSDMPNTIIVLSDMQFNSCMNDSSLSSIEMIRRQYANAGYDVPNMVFWNLRTSHGIPVRFDETGTALVSGFSPSTLQHILSGKFNPMDQMLAVLESERYERLNSITV